LVEALRIQQEQGGYIGEILVSRGHIDETVRDSLLSLQKLMGSSTRLSELEIAPELLRRIPPRVARDSAVLPLLQVQDWLVVAVAQREDQALLDEIARITGNRIYPV